MKRIERWIFTLLVVHGFLLILAQILIDYSNVHIYVDPVYKYLGVLTNEDENILKTLSQALDNVLSF
ncbi:DUF5359 family protein [Aquibacillus saliphilus]|uniref:DUF5359 family protein n=1 Tax=Aquibacillus saliphilus TaxID=1909422 RepID=UPI001CEFD609|nr:DUF5359 family protein [Aquibacillus saliphilus]